MEMMQTVRGFINLIKANPTTREHYKSNKLATHKYDNEVNESGIQSSSLDQVQQFFSEDTDLVFDALVAADYIDEIDCADGIRHPNICTYPMIADLKDRESNATTPFAIVNFSHHEHLHLPKDHVVAFAEKDCNEGEVLEICTMEQLEKDIPRNWIPERKRQEKLSEFFENPSMKKDDDFLKSPAEAPVHRKVLLEDKNISPKTQEAFDKLCDKYDDIISKNSGDIGKTM